MLRRALSFALALTLASACSYDFTPATMPRVDAGPMVDGGALDGGPNVFCNPIADTGCMTSLACSAELDSEGLLTARCTLPGTSGSGAGCAGPGSCAPGLLCLSNAGGSASCVDVCTDTERCPGAQTCDRSESLYTLGAHTVYRCR